MGQILFEDKITTLSESLGTITLPSGARLTIGGQQFTIDSNLTVAVPSFSAILERWFLYVVLSGGVPTLITSQNVNSTGPVGYDSWKLVGAFYSGAAPESGTLQFGAFITIKGKPTTGLFNTGTAFLRTQTTASVTYGTVNHNRSSVQRDGNKIFVQTSFQQTAAGTSPGAGQTWVCDLVDQANLSFDTDVNADPSTAFIQAMSYGQGYITDNTQGKNVNVGINNSSSLESFFFNFDDAGSNRTADTDEFDVDGGNFRLGFNAEAAINEWDNTPLEDL